MASEQFKVVTLGNGKKTLEVIESGKRPYHIGAFPRNMADGVIIKAGEEAFTYVTAEHTIGQVHAGGVLHNRTTYIEQCLDLNHAA